MEYTEDREVERSYIQPEKLEEVMNRYEERLLKEAASQNYLEKLRTFKDIIFTEERSLCR